VEVGDMTKAYPLDEKLERACVDDEIQCQRIAVFWYGPTQTAIAFESAVEGQTLTFAADDVSPESAPFKDKETGTRWTIAGRAVDGPLRGKELTWVPSIQCRWYAWSGEHPETAVYEAESEKPALGRSPLPKRSPGAVAALLILSLVGCAVSRANYVLP
jgi:hypothetical protein